MQIGWHCKPTDLRSSTSWAEEMKKAILQTIIIKLLQTTKEKSLKESGGKLDNSRALFGKKAGEETMAAIFSKEREKNLTCQLKFSSRWKCLPQWRQNKDFQTCKY